MPAAARLSAAVAAGEGRLGAAPRRARVGAQRRGVQALAEDLGGRALGATHDAHDPPQMARVAGARLAQGGEHARKGRRADAQRDQRVVDLRPTQPVLARPHDRREVGRRVARAVLRAADEPQNARGLAHAVDLERVEAGRRHHRVEHQPGHAVGVGDGVALGHEGAVGDAVEGQLVRPQRDAQRLEVRRRCRPSSRSAGAARAPGRTPRPRRASAR